MRMLKGQLLIFLIIYVSESSCVIDALYDTGKRIWEFYSTLEELNLTCLANPRTVEELFRYDHGVNGEIRHQIYEIDFELREIGKSMNSEIMNNLVKIVRFNVLIVKCIDLMKIFTESIDDSYTRFYQRIIQHGYMHYRPLDDSTTSVFSDIESNIGMIRKIMTDPNELLPGQPNFITAINGYAKTHYAEICDSSQSIDEIFVYLFKMAIIAEMKTSLMGAFANLHRCREYREWKLENTYAKTQFQTYFGTYVSIMQRNLDLAKGLYIRACDPKDGAWILNENYYEMDGITQAILFRYQPKVCPYTSCRNKWQRRSTRCDAKYYDGRSGCSSTPTDCEDFGAVQACLLMSGPHKYQYVNSTRLGFYGNNSKCPEDNGLIIDNREGPHSGYATCGCYCDGNHYKISLVIMESTGNATERVITGLRFKRQNNILHIQPRVGELMTNGYIQRSSEIWLQIPNDINASQSQPINTKNSLFFLDDVLLPSKFVLTGIGFKEVTRGAVTGFAIEIFGVPFDYRSGQLDLRGKIRLSSSRDKSGQPLLFDAISSLQTKLDNVPSSSDLKYVKLAQSQLRIDFGQSTLPLFDAVPVTTDPPLALGGIGIFHKGVTGYAGFISVRTYGIRYTQYFENFTSDHTIDDKLELFDEL